MQLVLQSLIDLDVTRSIGAGRYQGPKVVAKAVVIATGVRSGGGPEVLGLTVGDSEDGAFWTFLRSLRARGVKLVVSGAHEGPRALRTRSRRRCSHPRRAPPSDLSPPPGAVGHRPGGRVPWRPAEAWTVTPTRVAG